MGGGSQAVQTVVGKGVAVAAAVCSPVHSGDVAVVACAAVVVGQRLRELAPGDARQPAAKVVGIRRSVQGATQLLAV